MKLRFMEGNRTGRLVDVDKDTFVIGRDITCDLMLDEDGISRKHCQIVHEGDDYFFEDLESTNGVYRNGEKLKERTKLDLNDKLRIGSVLFLFTDATGILSTQELEKVEKAVEEQRAKAKQAMAEEPKSEEAPGKKSAVDKVEDAKKVEKANKAITAAFIGIMVLLAVLLLAMLMAPTGDGNNANNEDPGNGMVQNPPGNGDNGVTPPAAADDDDDDDVPPADDDDDDDVAADDDDDDDSGNPDDPTKVPDPVFREKITYYWVRSEPSGATVAIDGKEVGKTPYMVMGLATGTHDLKLTAQGYRELNRVFQIPFRNRFFTYELERKAGTCLITSEPTDMAIFEKGLFIGRTPMLLERSPEDYAFEVGGAGYIPQKIMARVSMAIPTKVRVSMRPSAGAIQLVTLPAGAKAYLDGFYVGQTEANEKGESKPLLIEGIRSGTHQLHIEHTDGKSEPKALKIERGLASKVRVMIYKADTQITTRDRKKYRGMFVRKKSNGDLVLALRPDKFITVKAANVAQMRAWEAGE